MMETADQLLLITEVSIALTGFSGIVASFQFRTGEHKSRGDVVGLATIVQLGLMSALLSFIPLAISNFGIPESTSWSLSSALSVIVFGIFLVKLYPHTRKMHFRGVNRIVIRGWWVFNFMSIFAMCLNALQIGFHGDAAPYVAMLLNPLCFTGYMFARLLLRPLWRYIREQESAELS
jgi:hypothetical protein